MRRVLVGTATVLALLGAYGCASDCENACDKLKQCFSDAPELGGATCVEDCDAYLADEAQKAETQKCLDCINRNDCSAIFPTDGSESSCVYDCGYIATPEA